MLYYVPHGVAWHAIMVDYNSKERGIRIGDSRVRGIVVGCLHCQHHARMELADALATFGNAYARDVAQRLRCTRCNERKGYVQAWAETRPKS